MCNLYSILTCVSCIRYGIILDLVSLSLSVKLGPLTSTHKGAAAGAAAAGSGAEAAAAAGGGATARQQGKVAARLCTIVHRVARSA